MVARAGVAALLMVGALATLLVPSGPLPKHTAPPEPQQCCPYYPYDGSLTFVRIRTASYGRSPSPYVSEPDEWRVTESEAEGLRTYLMKGGLVIFDDFFAYEMENLVRQMGLVFPELRFLPIEETHPVWDSFYRIEPLSIYLEGPRKYGTPEFWGLYENNDRNGRLLAIANAGADIGDLWEWAAQGWYPVDPTSEAFRIGVNYFIYAVTH